jgi:hypothetical protein
MLRNFSGTQLHTHDFIINQHMQALASHVDPAEGTFFMNHTSSDGIKHFLSTKGLKELKPINIKDLVIGKTHLGFYLKVKIALKSMKMTAVQTVIEDDNKTVTRLSVYNFFTPQNFKYRDVYYVGRTLYIIEPYFKLARDGVETIRVDQPNDIIFDEQITLNLSLDPNSLKENANKAFAEQNYELAISLYDQAISKFDLESEAEDKKSKLKYENESEKLKSEYETALEMIKSDYDAKIAKLILEFDGTSA